MLTLKVAFVLEVDLEVEDHHDAALQVGTVARKLERFREQKLRQCRSLRIGVDEPTPRGPQVATAILGLLDAADVNTAHALEAASELAALVREVEPSDVAEIPDDASCPHGVTARQLRAGARCGLCDPLTEEEIAAAVASLDDDLEAGGGSDA